MQDSQKVFKAINTHKIIAVVRCSSYEQAFKEIEAIIAGGIKLIEITLTTPQALDLIKHFSQNQAVLIGAGSVNGEDQAAKAHQAGACFLVSPFYNFSVQDYAWGNELLYIPGFMTPTEAFEILDIAVEQKNCLLKLFPASNLGISYMQGLLKPMPYLKIMPSGGVDLTNVTKWLEAGAFAVSVGGALTYNLNHDEIVAEVKKYLEEIKKWQK